MDGARRGGRKLAGRTSASPAMLGRSRSAKRVGLGSPSYGRGPVQSRTRPASRRHLHLREARRRRRRDRVCHVRSTLAAPAGTRSASPGPSQPAPRRCGSSPRSRAPSISHPRAGAPRWPPPPDLLCLLLALDPGARSRRSACTSSCSRRLWSLMCCSSSVSRLCTLAYSARMEVRLASSSPRSSSVAAHSYPFRATGSERSLRSLIGSCLDMAWAIRALPCSAVFVRCGGARGRWPTTYRTFARPLQGDWTPTTYRTFARPLQGDWTPSQ